MVAEAVAVAEPDTTDAKYDDARRGPDGRVAEDRRRGDVSRPGPPRVEAVARLEAGRRHRASAGGSVPGVKIPPDKLVRKGGYNDVKRRLRTSSDGQAARGREDQAEKGAHMSKERGSSPTPRQRTGRRWASGSVKRGNTSGFSQDQVATFLGVPGRRCR